MSLFRSVKLPLLKLPYLCIKAVVESWDILDIIYFALLSKKTRRIVKSLNIPLNGIKIFVSDVKLITLGSFFETWYFNNEDETNSSFGRNQISNEYPLVLQKNAVRLYTTSKKDHGFKSHSNENEFVALKMAMEFLTEVFKCSIEAVHISDDNFPETGDIGVRSTKNLCITHLEPQRFSHAQNQKLKLLLENLEVIDTCTFTVAYLAPEFNLDPKLLKCKKLVFSGYSSFMVTREILLQLEVPQLYFDPCWLSVEDVVSFVTHWFHSGNQTFEYLYVFFENQKVSPENFQTKELKPSLFSLRNRAPSSDKFDYIDFSKGLEIVRHDGLQATIHAGRRVFLFYVWHDQ